MSDIWRDLRYAYRTILRRPLFAIAAIVCLGVGIGGTAAIFSLADAILWKSLPVQRPTELAFLGFSVPRRPEPVPTISYPLATAIRGRIEGLQDIAVYRSLGLNVRVRNQTDRAIAELVSLNYFDLLGVSAARGRVFTELVDRAESAPTVAVLSHGYWQRRFGSDPSVVGADVVVDGTPFSVIGVARDGFFGLDVGNGPDLWIPVTTLPLVAPQPPVLTMPNNASFRIVARLVPSPLTHAQTATRAQPSFAAIVAEEAKRDQRGRMFAQAQLQLLPTSNAVAQLQRQFARPTIVVLGGAAILLAIGSSNLAALLLAQAAARRREVAMRLALGASRWRLIRQLSTESLALTLTGGLVGVLVAYWMTHLLGRAFSNLAAIRLELALDWRTIAFTATVSIALGVLFGLTPAFQALRASVVNALKGDASTGRSWRGQSGLLRRCLVGGQIALSVLLLVSAGLFGRSLFNVSMLNLGMRVDGVLQASLRVPQTQTAERVEAFYSTLEERLRGLAGVQGVGTSEQALFTTRTIDGIEIEGYKGPAGEDRGTLINRIGPGFAETLGLTVLSGRTFAAHDTAQAPAVAMVSRALAVRYFGGTTALGRRITVGFDGTAREIIGVVSDASYDDDRLAESPIVYLPLSHTSAPPAMRTIYIRTAGDPATFMAAVQREVQALDGNVGVYDVKRLDDRVNEMRAQERLLAFMATMTSALSIVLTGIGIYGLLAYELTRRTREFGIRMALGATRGDVTRLVWRESFVLCAISVCIGIGIALSLSSVVATQLFGVSARDPLTLLMAVASITIVLVIATMLPTLWSLRLSPVGALRHE